MPREINKKLNEYISLITLNFLSETYYEKELMKFEKKRIKQIRKAIILVLKIYHNVSLTKYEEEMLDNYPLKYDIKTEIEKCITSMCYNISYDTWERVNNIRTRLYDYLQNHYKYDSYENYLRYLDEYLHSLRHAIVWNEQISLTDHLNRTKVYPTINYNDATLTKIIRRKRIFTR